MRGQVQQYCGHFVEIEAVIKRKLQEMGVAYICLDGYFRLVVTSIFDKLSKCHVFLQLS